MFVRTMVELWGIMRGFFLCKIKAFGGVVELGNVAMGDCKEASIRI
jgi:hypothetical protein